MGGIRLTLVIIVILTLNFALPTNVSAENCTDTISVLSGYFEFGAIEKIGQTDSKLSNWEYPFKQNSVLFIKNFAIHNSGSCEVTNTNIRLKLQKPSGTFHYMDTLRIDRLKPNTWCMVRWGSNKNYLKNYTNSCGELKKFYGVELEEVGQWAVSLNDPLTDASYAVNSMIYDEYQNRVLITGSLYFEVCDKNICQQLEYQKEIKDLVKTNVDQSNISLWITTSVSILGILVATIVAIVGINKQIKSSIEISEKQINKIEELEKRKRRDSIAALVNELRLNLERMDMLRLGEKEFSRKNPTIFWYDFSFYGIKNALFESLIADKSLIAKLNQIYLVLETNNNLLEQTRKNIPKREIQRVNKNVIKIAKVYRRLIIQVINALEKSE